MGEQTQMIDPSGSETFTYDQNGRITQAQKVVGSTNYASLYKYNVADEVTQVTYPSGRLVTTNYDQVGKVLGVSDATINYVTIPSSTGYDALGHVLTMNYGNGVVGNFSYSGPRAQLAGLTYKKGASTYFNLRYWFQQDANNCAAGTAGNNGQIQCITDLTDAGRSVNYGYDLLGRLGSAVTTGSSGYAKWGLSWGYDRYGNRLNQTVTAGTAPSNTLTFSNPGGAQTNRPDGMCFDASGNLLQEAASPCPPPSPTRVYDAENDLVGYQTAAYTYDGNGLRVKKIVSGTTTVYIYSGDSDIAEYDNGAAPTSPTREYIYSSGQLVATVGGGKTTYYHHDHLSARVSTDGTTGSPTYGQVIGQQGHFPYGEAWYASGTTTKFVFTSYEHDTESGDDYAVARTYIERFGRFCSADPVLGFASDPQSWNRYAYSRNDPINRVDPKGLFGFLIFLIELLFSFLNSLFMSFWTQGMFGHSFVPNFGFMDINVAIGTPPTFPTGGGGIDWHALLPGGQNDHYGTPPFLATFSYAAFAEKVSAVGLPTPCFGQFQVLRGNKKHIGKKGATGRRIRSNSAAVDPAQFGGLKTGEDLRPFGEQVSGEVSTPGFGKDGRFRFSNISEVVNSKDIRGVKAGADARAAIRNRMPGTMTLELPGLPAGPKGKIAPEGPRPGIIYMPPGLPCPEGTTGPPGVPAPPRPV